MKNNYEDAYNVEHASDAVRYTSTYRYVRPAKRA